MRITRYTSRSLATASLILSASALAPSIAHAQMAEVERGPENPDEIFIDGLVDVDGGDAVRQARDITQRMGSNTEPMARFQRPICPGVWGLAENNAKVVISRIYDNAERAGLDIDETPGCTANIWVIVVDNPAETFDKLVDENSWMTRNLTGAETKAVQRQYGPVRAWNITSTRDEYGVPIPTGFDAQTRGIPGAPNWVSTTRMSRLHVPIRRDIEMSVIALERATLGEVDAIAIADYATMRGLARTEEPERARAFDTVLTMFDGKTNRDRISAFDIAYLRSLYKSSAHRPSRMAMAGLEKYMEEELARGPDEEN